MRDFDYEVLQRKNLARQARFKKNGSKSKRCTLLSDRMTQKQWKERCGAIMTYKMSTPMDFEEFKKVPADIQKEYLESLIGKYQATAADIARMFNVATTRVIRLCNREDIGIKFTRGKKMPKDKRVEFEAMIAGETKNEAETQEVPEDTVLQNACDIELPVSNMGFNEFSLKFSGPLNAQMIANSVLNLVPHGTNVVLELKCTML